SWKDNTEEEITLTKEHGCPPNDGGIQRQDPEVSRCFMGCSAVIVADPPPTAHHSGDSGWKSRRCCGGHDSGVGGWRDKVECLERVEKCGGDSSEKSAEFFSAAAGRKMERMWEDFELPDTTMVRLWWPQPARPPPQRWRQAAEHNDEPLGVAPPQPDTTWCGCGGCTIVRPPPGWWFGGGQPLMDQKQGAKSTTKLNIVFTLDVTTMHEKYRQDPEVSRCFMGCSAVIDVPPM
nr:hypothetical protein [Tanacetum cinerariifolium]